MVNLGKLAYDAYCTMTGWKSLKSGDPLPQWEDLPLEMKDAWSMAGLRVAEAINTEDS